MQNETVKNNILFGKTLNPELYQRYSTSSCPHIRSPAVCRVVTACALDSDLEMLPAGDSTEIGTGI